MPTHQYITISAPHSNRQIDLEVPAEEPIDAFLPDLIKVINWPEMQAGNDICYQLTDEGGQKLDQNKSLEGLGVSNFEVLILTMENSQGQPKPVVKVEETLQEVADQRGTPSPPFWAGIPIESPTLVSNQGMLFVLGQPPISIGRVSREFKPAIDLTELDVKLLSSRRHAEILKEGDKYVLHAFPTTNGTFINGSELPPGEKKALKNGDELQFGFRGVELVFRTR